MLGHGFGLGMTFVMFFGPLIVLLVVAAIVLWGGGFGADEGLEARRILAERLARGEITDDEYRRSMDLLRPGRLRR